MMSRTPFCLAFALTLTACTDDAPTSPDMEPAGATALATYNVVPLGALGGTGGEASDMEGGRIVGHAETEEGQFHAFLWENGVMRDLGALPSILPTSRAMALNTTVQVVGFSFVELPNGNSAEHGFLWQNGTMLDLGTLGGPDSRALDINSAGVIVGFAQNAAGNERAVRWVNGVIQRLGTLGGPTSQGLGINDAGVIVGRSQTKTGKFKAFVWRNGNMRAVGTLTEAFAINSAGHIVGATVAGTGFQHAALWRNGQTIDLGVLLGDHESAALDIDDAGRITGYSIRHTATGERTRVFLWENGKLKNLGNSAGKPNRALGISPAGNLVGSSTENGNQVAVLWRRQ